MTRPSGWKLVGSALLVACGGSEAPRGNDSSGRPGARRAGSPAPNASPTARPEVRQGAKFAHLTALPTGPWTRLAQKITESKNLQDEAVGPRAPSYATPGETVRLAIEARNRRSAGRMTAAEVAQMLKGFGWPFKSTGRSSDQAAIEPKGSVEMTDSRDPAPRAHLAGQ